MFSRQSARKVTRGANDGARRSQIWRFLPLLLIALVLATLTLMGTGQPASAESGSRVDVVLLNSQIDASSQRFITGAIGSAEKDGAQALVIEVNTPGGAIDSMQAIITAELNSTVPIITYVSPSGAYAASAGALITLAAPLAAMAPSTTIGASSPVNSDGSNLGSTEQSKVESVLVSDITNIQTRYKRNVGLATRMITNAASYGDQQAQAQGLVDIDASNLNALLNQANGRVVTFANGQSVTLQTAGASVRDLNPGLVDNLYGLLADPNIVFLLFIVAIIGIYVEISHPGLILPGVMGSISLLLFLFGAGSLAPNWAGLALMVLAFVLLILDMRLPTHGVLTLGAVVSLIVGALLFFNSGSGGPYQGEPVNPLVIIAMSALVGGLGFYIVAIVIRTRRARVSTGVEGMIGTTVTALTPLLPTGRVSYGGEDWSAVLDPPVLTVDAGSELRIVAVDGLLLHVQLATTLPSPVDRNSLEGI
ncbi:MAG TPA: nodulation protein NfeD [Ktedonobacteraceae bacterium]|jgi:membrane-bound serine protease (ClpP class)